jgi:hypothetical protein
MVPPAGYRLVVNIATARRLGLSVPSALLINAEVVGQ